MKYKTCTKCHKRKPVSEFVIDKRIKGNYTSWCKKCISIYQKKYREINKKRIKELNKIYREKHKQEILRKKKKYYQAHKEKIIEYTKKYYKNNKKIILQRIKRRYKVKRKQIIKYNVKYRRLRRRNEIKIRLHDRLSKRIWDAVKENCKSAKTVKLIGCSIEKLEQHLQKQFKVGMTWDNYGFYGWHVDHILPCASFDLSKKSEQLKCFNYKNLQPLWAEENWSKNRKILEE